MTTAQLTPADEIRAAADMLRNALYPGAFSADRTVAALVRAHDPIATWLERHAGIAADVQEQHGDGFTEDALDHDTRHALAVARAMNEETP
ncbi:hypothetical protein ACF060_31195 [Streptomyces werraensis]|uniref:hypothetical protein n=1 Tax=Streptomyces TaxID=1883 RepID=UPI0022548422|nr:hypothetical protein [Streptomyces viridodiastaticus]MCX4571562.1 hypothetical protein [Streptomyces viridodiastaticus]